jgi:hypothetical protein
MCRILPCPRTYFHERIRCRLHSAPTKQFAVLHLHSSFFLLPSPRHGFGRLCSLLLHSSFFLLPSPQCGFARFFCIHHSSFLILHSPQGILDKPWTCPGTIAPPQTPVFEQPSLSRPLSCGISAAERFRCATALWSADACSLRLCVARVEIVLRLRRIFRREINRGIRGLCGVRNYVEFGCQSLDFIG